MGVDFKEKGVSVAYTTVVSDMKTAASIALFTVPTGKKFRATGLMVRDATASLAGGSVYSITNWRQSFSLATLITASTGYLYVQGADLAQYTETGAGVIIYLVIGTGSTLAAGATIDLIGVLSDA